MSTCLRYLKGCELGYGVCCMKRILVRVQLPGVGDG